MKANMKKQLRLQVIVGMVVVALVIMTGDATTESALWVKGAAIAMGAAAFGLFRRWNKKGMLPRMEDL